MLKTILISALLAVQQLLVFASPVTPGVLPEKTTVTVNNGVDETTILCLSREKDFEALVVETGLLLGKVRLTGSFPLIKKAAASTATAEELQQLTTNLGFESVAGLKLFAAKQQAQRAFLLKKYPQLTNPQQAGIIITASIEANCELREKIEKMREKKLYPMSFCYAYLTLAQLCLSDPDGFGGGDPFACWSYFIGLFEFCLLNSEDF